MGLPVEVNPLFLENQYAIQRSLRFRSSASAYLSRTFGTPTSTKKFTFSFWVKRGNLTVATYSPIFTYNNASNFGQTGIYLNPDDTMLFVARPNGSSTVSLLFTTSAVFRDVSSWYHFLFSVDTTQALSSNGFQLYVNGSQITSFSSSTYTQNADINFTNGLSYQIGSETGNSRYLDGYLAEFNFIDGQALTPSSFGQYNEFGVWSPRKYGGSYGTNGFYLQFTDIALTSGSNAGLGKDFSGNTNYWNTNNISVTAGTTYDAMTDVPPPSTIQNVRAGNYCTLNPNGKLYNNVVSTVSNGNLTATGSGTILQGTMATPTSGKYYFEMKATTVSGTDDWVGFILASATGSAGVSGTSLLFRSNGQKFTSSAWATYGSSWTSGNIIGCAIDLDNGAIYFAINNTWQTSGDPTSGSAKTGAAFTNATMQISGISYGIIQSLGTGSGQQDFNFGQQPLTYTPPSGYLPLNSNNLPAPTIPNGAKVMAAVLYTGNGNANGDTQTITATTTNSGNNPLATTFQPDLVWVKDRITSGSSTYDYHLLADSVRGAGNEMNSNTTAAEYAGNQISAFNVNGFNARRNTSYNQNNIQNTTYVGWQWNAGSGTSSSNTDGTITSTVSVNKSAGFSVVTWTGNGSATADIGHGLGASLAFIIVKNRTSTSDWWTWHWNMASGVSYIGLNTTNADNTVNSPWGGIFNSTVFRTTNNATNNANASSNNYVAYCWTPIAGYSAVGKYTGNSSADGPFIYTGFRPRWIMIKRIDAAGYDWPLIDSSRSSYNMQLAALYADLSNAEASGADGALDILSNGFKIRTNAAGNLNSSGTYIYAAFAENPFKLALAR